jgi:uncharacterized membrane protein
MKAVAPKKIDLLPTPFAAQWIVTAGLLLLSAVPIIAGASRITQLAGGAEVTADNARFFASPIPVVVHIISASLYAVLGAFQFAPSIRRSQPGRHRAIGRFLIPFGLAAALSGLWMANFYPWPKGDGQILYGLRLIFGSAMTLSLGLGYAATRRRDFVQHGVWMTRAYAIGLGAGTQVLTHLPYILLFGAPSEFTRAVLMGAGWVINLMVAEWVIYKRLAHSYPQSQRR